MHGLVPCFRLNTSLSVKGTLFLVLPGKTPLERGAYVEHCLPEALAAPILAVASDLPRCPGGGVALVKRIAGLPFDPITTTATKLRLPGQILLFVPGVARQPQSDLVPAGTVFLAGDAVRSFDSRYFGTVPLADTVHLLRIF